MTYECSCIEVSVSMPDELVSTVRDYAGAAMFDKYVAAAVEQRLRLDLLAAGEDPVRRVKIWFRM